MEGLYWPGLDVCMNKDTPSRWISVWTLLNWYRSPFFAFWSCKLVHVYTIPILGETHLVLIEDGLVEVGWRALLGPYGFISVTETILRRLRINHVGIVGCGSTLCVIYKNTQLAAVYFRWRSCDLWCSWGYHSSPIILGWGVYYFGGDIVRSDGWVGSVLDEAFALWVTKLILLGVRFIIECGMILSRTCYMRTHQHTWDNLWCRWSTNHHAWPNRSTKLRWRWGRIVLDPNQPYFIYNLFNKS